jgi:hypothetical protein
MMKKKEGKKERKEGKKGGREGGRREEEHRCELPSIPVGKFRQIPPNMFLIEK